MAKISIRKHKLDKQLNKDIRMWRRREFDIHSLREDACCHDNSDLEVAAWDFLTIICFSAKPDAVECPLIFNICTIVPLITNDLGTLSF